MRELRVRTERQSQLVDITRLVEEAVAGADGSAVLVYVPHTTAGVTIPLRSRVRSTNGRLDGS